MFRFLKRRKMMWAVAALALGSSAAWAAGRGGGPGCGEGGGCGGCGHHGGGPHGGHGEFFKARLDAHLADLIELTKASPEQKQALTAARDRIAARMQAHHGPGPAASAQAKGPAQGKGPAGRAGQGPGADVRAAHHRQMQALFQADAPDPKQIEALRDAHLQRRGELAMGMLDELGQLHAVFNRDQRKAMASYLQDLRPGQRGQWRERMGQFWAGRMVERLADEVKATPEQKKALAALADKAAEAVKGHRQAQQQLTDKALALWQGERWDAAQAQALHKAAQEQARSGADAAIRLGLEAHKLLTPAQRKLAAALIGRHGPGGRGHGPHGGPGVGAPPEDAP